MSLLSILAVAICAKPELSLQGVKVRALLAGAVEQSLRDAGCYGGEDAMVGRMREWHMAGWRGGGIGDGEVRCLAAHNLGDYNTSTFDGY